MHLTKQNRRLLIRNVKYVLNNLAGNKCTENQSHMKIFQLTVMTQKKETYSKHKGTFLTLFFPKICKSCTPDWKDAILQQATVKAPTKEVFMVISIMFYRRQYKTTVINTVRTV
jgi:hypothetical protein